MVLRWCLAKCPNGIFPENIGLDKLYSILAQVLGLDPKEISDSTSPETTETWDSFNGLVLVSELETKFKVKFTTEEVYAVKNVGDIKAALRRHHVEL